VVRTLESILAEQAMRDADDSDLSSRSDARRARLSSEAALIELGERLLSLNRRQLDSLQLPELLLEALQTARAIESPPARARAMKRVRRELRDGDEAGIRRQLAALADPRASVASAESQWLSRLQAEGSTALEEFLAAHPAADRQRLRSLLRNLERAAAAAQPKARAALQRALKDAMTPSAVDEPESSDAIEAGEPSGSDPESTRG